VKSKKGEARREKQEGRSKKDFRILKSFVDCFMKNCHLTIKYVQICG